MFDPVENNLALQEEFEKALRDGQNPKFVEFLNKQSNVNFQSELFGLLIDTVIFFFEEQNGHLPTENELCKSYSSLAPQIRKLNLQLPISSEDFPSCIDKFVDLKPIGSGRQGTVLRGVDRLSGIEVAVKFSSTPDASSWLENEAIILSSLSHVHIVPIIATGIWQDHAYMVMPYVFGETLFSKYSELKTGAVDCLSIIFQICSAVSHLHENDILHRDISCQNIMVDGKGQATLIDFGLAIRKDGLSNPHGEFRSLCGTIGFVAPEQAKEILNSDGNRSDVFSIGAVMYWLLTGRTIFAGGNEKERLCNTLTDNLDPERKVLLAKFPQPIRDTCLKATAINPANRFASTALLSSSIEKQLKLYQPQATRREELPEGASTEIPIKLLLFFAVTTFAGLSIFHALGFASPSPLLRIVRALAICGSTLFFVVGSVLSIDSTTKWLFKRSIDEVFDFCLGRWGNYLTSITYIPNWHEAVEDFLDRKFGSKLFSWKAFKASVFFTRQLTMQTFLIALIIEALPLILDDTYTFSNKEFIYAFFTLHVFTIAAIFCCNFSFDFFSVTLTRWVIKRIDISRFQSVLAWLTFDFVFSFFLSIAPAFFLFFLVVAVHYILGPEAEFINDQRFTEEGGKFMISTVLTGIFTSVLLWGYIGMAIAGKTATVFLNMMSLGGRMLEYLRSILSVMIFLSLLILLALVFVEVFEKLQ